MSTRVQKQCICTAKLLQRTLLCRTLSSDNILHQLSFLVVTNLAYNEQILPVPVVDYSRSCLYIHIVASLKKYLIGDKLKKKKLYDENVKNLFEPFPLLWECWVCNRASLFKMLSLRKKRNGPHTKKRTLLRPEIKKRINTLEKKNNLFWNRLN